MFSVANTECSAFPDETGLASFVDCDINVRHSLIGHINCESGTGSSAELGARFDMTVCVGSSSSGSDMGPNVCGGMRGNRKVAFCSGFEHMFIGLTVGTCVLRAASSAHGMNAEPMECIEVMGIAAVELGSNIQRKLLEDLEKKIQIC
jgi:hypothetical protein